MYSSNIWHNSYVPLWIKCGFMRFWTLCIVSFYFILFTFYATFQLFWSWGCSLLERAGQRSELELDSWVFYRTGNVDGVTCMMSCVSGSVMTFSSSGASSPGCRLNMETSRRDSRVIIPLTTSRGNRTRTDSQLKQSWIVAPAKALRLVTVINCAQSGSPSSTLMKFSLNFWTLFFFFDKCDVMSSFGLIQHVQTIDEWLFYYKKIKHAICPEHYLSRPDSCW